jgi:Rad3-related DNA helicase
MPKKTLLGQVLIVGIPFEPMERMVVSKAAAKIGLSFEDYVKGHALAYAHQDIKGGQKNG